MVKHKRILILGAALAVLVIGGYLAIRMALPDASGKAVEVVEEKPIGEFYMVDGIMVNPAGSKGARFLRASAALEALDSQVMAELARRDVQIRDILITELSANSIGQLMDPVSKEEIRNAIIQKVNRLLTSGSLTNLYFLEYIVQ